MSAIRILESSLINKIAAGEVVERPASVVRELVENSLDAGATRITVEVEQAGRKLIRVSDDGSGMGEADALMAVERHATSKLTKEDDLFSIGTMGFRGEALPSIASVSKMRVTTAVKGAAHGVSFEVVDGRPTSPAPSAGEGTSIEVRELFHNTPARKKFLKRDSTELMHIVDAVTKLALSHPGTGFTLMVNNEPNLELPPASGLRERLVQVYGAEFVEGLAEVGKDADAMSVKGFVSRPSSLRETRAHQVLFVNRRPVRDPSVSHAVFSSYDGLAPRGLHPVFFIFLEMDSDLVDVNVHPAKREVRFSEKDGVYRFVRRAVSDIVRGAPGMGTVPTGPDGPVSFGGGVPGSMPDVRYPEAHAGPAGFVAESLPDAFRPDLPFIYSSIYLGESFVGYSDSEGGLWVLDHHAAHERVLYEKLLGGLEMDSGRLLFPRQVELSRKEHAVALENSGLFSEFGMEIDDFGGTTLVVRSMPDGLDEADVRGILSDAVGAVLEGERPGRNLREAVAARLACHSSVRGSRVLAQEELGALLEALDACDDPAHCPHGRPTRIRYTLKDLRKLFKRS